MPKNITYINAADGVYVNLKLNRRKRLQYTKSEHYWLFDLKYGW